MTEAEVRAAHPDWNDVMVAQFMQIANSFGISSQPKTPTSSKTSGVQTSITKLTPESALALLEQSAKAAGYPKEFSPAEVADFIKKFDAEQKTQIAKVITIAGQKTTPGATAEATSKVFEQTMQEEYPSFFKPADFAKDFIWSKVNFKDQATLGSAVVGTLAAVRGLVDKFHIIDITDQDKQNMALAIAKGDKTVEQATVELQQIAKREYPQFADRFDKDPTLTTADIAAPIVSTLASVWEVDKSEIKMDNPLVMKWMQGVSADGKSVPPTKYEIMLAAKKDPKYQYTQAANNDARDAAVAAMNALGVGI